MCGVSFLFPKKSCTLTFIQFLSNLLILQIHFFISFRLSCKGHELKFLNVTLPRWWNLEVLSIKGVSLFPLEYDTVSFQSFLIPMNSPMKYSLISVVVWINYNEISNCFWHPFPFFNLLIQHILCCN